jgi:hypothetical protein
MFPPDVCGLIAQHILNVDGKSVFKLRLLNRQWNNKILAMPQIWEWLIQYRQTPSTQRPQNNNWGGFAHGMYGKTIKWRREQNARKISVPKTQPSKLGMTVMLHFWQKKTHQKNVDFYSNKITNANEGLFFDEAVWNH